MSECYDVRKEYAHILDERTWNAPPQKAELCGEGYVIALRDTVDGRWYVGKDGKNEVLASQSAMNFGTYAEAVRFMVAHCEITNMPVPIPRGFERPKFPRVCFYRLYEEITEL